MEIERNEFAEKKNFMPQVSRLPSLPNRDDGTPNSKPEGAIMKYFSVLFILFICPIFAKDSREFAGKNYKFTEKWFDYNIPVWEKLLSPLQGKPNLNYLEVGVFEGRSFFWALEEIFTHSSARLTAMDLFLTNGQYKTTDFVSNFFHNLEISGAKDRIHVVKGYSQDELRKLPLETYDVIYIDGSHKSHDVFMDIADCWRLLKRGGILILDDYLYDFAKIKPVEAGPRPSIDSFLNTFFNEIEILHRDSQVFVRKLKRPCHGGARIVLPRKTFCFYYDSLELMNRDTDKFIRPDRTILSRLLKVISSRRYDDFTSYQEIIRQQDPTLVDILKKL